MTSLGFFDIMKQIEIVFKIKFVQLFIIFLLFPKPCQWRIKTRVQFCLRVPLILITENRIDLDWFTNDYK